MKLLITQQSPDVEISTSRVRTIYIYIYIYIIYSNRLFDLTDFSYSYLQLVVGTDPSQGIYRGNYRPRCSFSILYLLRFQHHNVCFQHQQLLVARCSSAIHNCQQRTSPHN